MFFCVSVHEPTCMWKPACMWTCLWRPEIDTRSLPVYWDRISSCEHEILCILRRDLSLWTWNPLYTEVGSLPVNMKSCVYWGGISPCECELKLSLVVFWGSRLYLPPYRDYRLAMTPAWLLCGFWGSMLCYPGLHGRHLIHQAISPALKFLFLKMLLSSKARVESSQVTREIIEHFSIFFFPMVPRIKPRAPCKLGKHTIVEIHPSPWDRFPNGWSKRMCH